MITVGVAARNINLGALAKVKSQRFQRKLIGGVIASVILGRLILSTSGIIFDVLTESRGDMLSATNAEALEAAGIFHELEGIDIDPAAGVAFATLLKACKQGTIDPRATVLLHITGTGSQRRERYRLVAADTTLDIDLQTLGLEAAVTSVLNLF